MAALIWILLLLPLVLAGVCFGLRRQAWTLWLPVLAAGVLLSVGVVLIGVVGSSGALTTAFGLLRVDALSAWMLGVVGAVAVVALWPYREHSRSGASTGSAAVAGGVGGRSLSLSKGGELPPSGASRGSATVAGGVGGRSLSLSKGGELPPSGASRGSATVAGGVGGRSLSLSKGGELAPSGASTASANVAGRVPKRENENIGSFATLLCLFLAAMTLAVVADNVGLMWVAIELTTITTAFLVASRGGRGALEAAWKYVVLGAVGVAIAFLGIALLSAASLPLGEATVSWVELMAHADALDPTLTRAAGALVVLGFATKAGLAPMHSWLPDAHSQAPAPVSGLMSGVLLSVAFYVILRIQAITDAAVGPELMRGLLLTAGLLSLAVTAGLVITQKDYKRLLAYSSIEHMGLLALGAAAGGPLAIAAVLLHMLGHGLVKSSMFVLAGRILSYTGSHRVADVRNLLQQRPDLGGPFLLGAAALLGFPPFVTFFTEVGIIVAGFQQGLTGAMFVACALLLVVFAGIARHVLAMTVGAEPSRPATSAEPPISSAEPSISLAESPVSLAEPVEASAALRQAQGSLAESAGALPPSVVALAPSAALVEPRVALAESPTSLAESPVSLAESPVSLAEPVEASAALRQAQGALGGSAVSLGESAGGLPPSVVALAPSAALAEPRAALAESSTSLAEPRGTLAEPVEALRPAPFAGARFRSVPITVALGLSAVLGFAAWPLLGPLTAAVLALGGAR